MARPNFTWYPDMGATKKMKPNVKPIKFGDGYEQRISSTINSNPRTWSIKFTRTQVELDQIDAFLQARNASESFSWTAPDSVTSVYLCREWSLERQPGGHGIISCDFEQTYDIYTGP